MARRVRGDDVQKKLALGLVELIGRLHQQARLIDRPEVGGGFSRHRVGSL
jgi:hypothetical protein